jgi:hypothetical protein
MSNRGVHCHAEAKTHSHRHKSHGEAAENAGSARLGEKNSSFRSSLHRFRRSHF